MADNFAKPILRPAHTFDAFRGADDPATQYSLARETAWSLLERVRNDSTATTPATTPAGINTDTDSVFINERMLRADLDGGLDDIAQLWSQAHPRSLPGALWRLYLIRAVVRNDPAGSGYTYQRGVENLSTIDPIVAGAAVPTGPEEVSALCDQILRGIFHGDFAVACERAGAFARVMRSGSLALAESVESSDPGYAQALLRNASRYAYLADDFRAVASLWRNGTLD